MQDYLIGQKRMAAAHVGHRYSGGNGAGAAEAGHVGWSTCSLTI